MALATGEFGVPMPKAEFDAVIGFTAETRLSGVDIGSRRLRKGAVDAVLKFAGLTDQDAPAEFRRAVDQVAPPVYTSRCGRRRPPARRHPPQGRRQTRHQGTLRALRAMGIRTVMVTGDNPVTAAAIASEAGVDDFLAQATPEDKLAYIRGNSRAVA